MEIIAKTKYDYETIRDFNLFHYSKKTNVKTIFIIISILCGFTMILIISDLIFDGFTPSSLTRMGIIAISYPFLCFMYFIYPKISYKAMKKMRNAENEYVFCDDSIKIRSVCESFTGESEIKYDFLIKAYETSKYFYLYQTKVQAYVADKSTITVKDAEEIRKKLMFYLGKKFILCKY